MKTSKSRAAIFLLLGAFPFLLLLTAELALRWRGDAVLRRPKCGLPDAKEIMRLAPGCVAIEDSPGGPYPFRTNEDGFRDRPRAFFRDGAVFLLGDSHVEGYRLPEDQGLARRLEVALGRKVLNLGLQGSGPGQEALRAMRALEHYTPRAAVWELNPNDTLDEIYFEALRSGERNPLQNPSLRDNPLVRLGRRLNGRSLLVEKLNEILFFQRPYDRFMSGRHFDPKVHCRSIRELSRLFSDKGVPLIFVLLSQGSKTAAQTYRGLDLAPGEFDLMVGCVKETGHPLIDLRDSFPDPKDYWPGDWHFTPEGTVKLATLMAERLKAVLPPEPLSRSASPGR